MTPTPQSGAYGWEDAWDTHDSPELSNVKKYRLPKPDLDRESGTFPNRTLHEGDRFWDTEERYMITVTDVRTKIYRGTVGPAGERGNDAVFYESDWHPPRPRGMFTEPYHPHRDGEPFHTDVWEFAKMLADGRLVSHRGNGIAAPP